MHFPLSFRAQFLARFGSFLSVIRFLPNRDQVFHIRNPNNDLKKHDHDLEEPNHDLKEHNHDLVSGHQNLIMIRVSLITI